ncbi:hypothetical protein K450DRAFT_232952 [Umbelopsis ramanniana AG]|uniref:Sulfhydryl oxidase n=1 Tax=Umbelopsis ramanniana AG TaxID=1314678 RepID=A0AAD5EEF1_UMBRA|nr:uncharacterized protein K450DRAFT_232952 [Umbelopsis ramanniana AG]KAI8581411.1 hypothetical protein K450DRAFT_232952 [Umbelopsis ramanniana AG]
MRAPPIQITLTACVLVFLTIAFVLLQPSKPNLHWQSQEAAIHAAHEPDVGGHVIMGKLGNETIKAELGRSTWKLLHTMTARFPLEPTSEERTALKQWITLLSRLYPCGECAEHFQVLLKQYPPQTSSRDAASQWACAVHNKVNERLEKPMFDCSLVADMYQCGCDEEEGSEEVGLI